MDDKHEKARELAEQALDALVEGDRKKGEAMIEKSRSLDPTALGEVQAEADTEATQAQNFMERLETMSDGPEDDEEENDDDDEDSEDDEESNEAEEDGEQVE